MNRQGIAKMQPTVRDALSLDKYSKEEKKSIMRVLARNNSLRRKDKHRIRALRSQRKEKTEAASHSSLDFNFLQICPKCDGYFALLFSKFLCHMCALEVCKDCIFAFYGNKLAVCCPCYREVLFAAKSGQWFWERFALWSEDGDPSVPIDPLDFLSQKLGLVTEFPPQNGGDMYPDNGSLRLELGHSGQASSEANLSDSILLMGLEDDTKIETGRVSQLSYYSEGAAQERRLDSVPSGGEIEMTIDYDFRFSVFRVLIRRCRNLEVDPYKHEVPNPFVRICLLPDKTRASRRKTKIKRQTGSPDFHEQFKYNIDKSALESRSLNVTVWHKKTDIFGGNVFLGEVSIPLDFCDFKSTEATWYQLRDQSPNFINRGNIVYRGDLDIAIKYVTPSKVNITDLNKLNSKGELQVWIKGARNLSCYNPKHVCSPRAKMFFLPDRSNQTKRKTPVGRRTNNPKWNVILKYEDIPFEGMEERGLEISVSDHDRFGGRRFLGGVRLNLGAGDPCRADIDWMDATGSECRMWVALVSRPNTWIDGTLPLRPQMD